MQDSWNFIIFSPIVYYLHSAGLSRHKTHKGYSWLWAPPQRAL